MGQHRQKILAQLTKEITSLSAVKSNLAIMTAITAIAENDFEKWVAHISDQLKAGHSAQVERMTSAKVVELIEALCP